MTREELPEQRRSCKVREGVIALSVEACNRETASNLLWAVLHLVDCTYQIREGDDRDRVIATQERGLMQVMMDNPGLFDFIRQRLRDTSG